MTPPAEWSRLGSSDKDALIQALLGQLAELKARVERLEAENTELRAKLDLRPKTPDNSGLPPSRGQKASQPAAAKPNKRPHAGAHRRLHPNPTNRRDCLASHCQHCGSDVAGVAQVVCEAYDRIEMPQIAPDVTRVSLYGGTCPCCSHRFKAQPPAGLEPGSPFGPDLRAFVIYLRSVQGIPLERPLNRTGFAGGYLV